MKRNIQLQISEEFAERTIHGNDSVRLLDDVIDGIDLLRGNKKVRVEITLLAIAYNINKYHHKIMDNRTGMLLHGKLSA